MTTQLTTVTLPTLQNGDSGSAVKLLQRLLIAQGYGGAMSFHMKADGVFGDQTESYVKAFQKIKGLDADGIVGKNTWDAISDGI